MANTRRGRPVLVDIFALLQSERAWIGLFCNLRDGTPAREVETRGSSGLFVKAQYEGQKYFEEIDGEMKERSGRETIYTMIPGQQPQSLKQPSIIDGPDEREDWQDKVRTLEEQFEQVMMGDVPIKHVVPVIPNERRIWESLKRARTAAAVRRAYSKSKIWLISRRDFPRGGFIDWSWSPFPRALYRQAEEFCRAKRDPRYPARDTRPYGDYRRIEYFGRVMAGLSLSHPISPSYSVDVLRKFKHLADCVCWRCRFEIAPRFPRSLVSFLSEGMR